MTRMLRSGALACALLTAGLAPVLLPVVAYAAEAAVAAANTAVVVPYGSWIAVVTGTIALAKSGYDAFALFRGIGR